MDELIKSRSPVDDYSPSTRQLFYHRPVSIPNFCLSNPKLSLKDLRAHEFYRYIIWVQANRRLILISFNLA